LGININGLTPGNNNVNPSSTSTPADLTQARVSAGPLRNPCHDVPDPNGPAPAPDPTSGAPTGAPRGTSNQPEVVESAPPRQSAPYPQPYITRPPQDYEPHTIVEKSPYPRVFSTATREVTVIPNSLFFTKDVNIAKILLTLLRGDGLRRPNHGQIYFNDRDANDLKTADLFRWSLDNYWTAGALSSNETIKNKVCSGHENPFEEVRQDQKRDTFSSDGTEIVGESRILQFAPPNAIQEFKSRLGHLGFDYKNVYDLTPIPASNNPYKPPSYKESFGFFLINKYTTKGWVNALSRGWDFFQFAYRYLPKAFQLNGGATNIGTQLDPSQPGEEVITNSQSNLAKENLTIFQNILLFGDRNAENWNKAKNLNGWTQADSSYYKAGIIREDYKYRDYVFDAPVAFFEDELNAMLMAPFHSAKITKKVGNVDFVNLKGYENELQVPNIYYYYNFMELKKDYEKGVYKNQQNSPAESLNNTGKNKILSAYSTNKKEEFYTTRDILKFPSDRVEQLEEINEFMRDYAENYVEIKINTTQGGHVNSLIQKNKMDRILMEVLYPNSSNGSRQIYSHARPINDKVAMVLDDSFQTASEEQQSVQKTLNDRSADNLTTRIVDGFYQILKDRLPNSSNNEYQKVDLEEYPLFHTGWNNPTILRLEETIRSQIFCKEYEEFESNTKLFRTYADLLSGEKAYSEVVGFKIEKHEILENEEEQLIQTFILMDSNDIESFSFIDSQVMPFKKYRYKILSINFVVATEYEYADTTPYGLAGAIGINVNSAPGYYLIEAPFFEQVVEIRDMPPMTPQVSFLPTQGVDDSLEIFLMTNYGESREPWYDPMADKQLLKTKYGMDRDGLITFKTDSLPSSFSIHRLEDAPEQYADFWDKTRQDYYFKRVAAVSNAGISKEDIEPNKYYYYIFRAYDNWDIGEPWNNKAMGSNPTEVFRVRMVSYANGIFLEMEPYEMKKEVRVDNISFERLIKIMPNFDQSIVDYSNTFKRLKEKVKIPNNSLEAARQEQGLMTPEQYIAGHRDFQESAPNPDELKLGTAKESQDSIWSRKFKIRIRSKDSGKMVDLNVKFVQDSDDLKKEE